MTPTHCPSAPQKPRLLDQVREAIRTHHYSRRTEDAYLGWIKRYIFFHGKRHPAEMGGAEITRFLSSLAVDGQVAASTQNQAQSALLFLYGEVLHQRLPWLDDIVRAKRPIRLPVVLTRDEVRAVLSQLRGTPRLMGTLLYGAGLRLLECAELRVKDVDFGLNQILVRNGKGQKDRATLLPASVKVELARHLEGVRQQHQKDLARGAGGRPEPRRPSGAPAAPCGAAISRNSTHRDRLQRLAANHGANQCPCTKAAPRTGVRLRAGGPAGCGEIGCKILQP